MSDWEATNSGDEEIQEAGNTIRLSSLEDNFNDILYWMAPPAYRGRKVTHERMTPFFVEYA